MIHSSSPPAQKSLSIQIHLPTLTLIFSHLPTFLSVPTLLANRFHILSSKLLQLDPGRPLRTMLTLFPFTPLFTDHKISQACLSSAQKYLKSLPHSSPHVPSLPPSVIGLTPVDLEALTSQPGNRYHLRKLCYKASNFQNRLLPQFPFCYSLFLLKLLARKLKFLCVNFCEKVYVECLSYTA